MVYLTKKTPARREAWDNVATNMTMTERKIIPKNVNIPPSSSSTINSTTTTTPSFAERFKIKNHGPTSSTMSTTPTTTSENAEPPKKKIRFDFNRHFSI